MGHGTKNTAHFYLRLLVPGKGPVLNVVVDRRVPDVGLAGVADRVVVVDVTPVDRRVVDHRHDGDGQVHPHGVHVGKPKETWGIQDIIKMQEIWLNSKYRKFGKIRKYRKSG